MGTNAKSDRAEVWGLLREIGRRERPPLRASGLAVCERDRSLS